MCVSNVGVSYQSHLLENTDFSHHLYGAIIMWKAAHPAAIKLAVCLFVCFEDTRRPYLRPVVVVGNMAAHASRQTEGVAASMGVAALFIAMCSCTIYVAVATSVSTPSWEDMFTPWVLV